MDLLKKVRYNFLVYSPGFDFFFSVADSIFNIIFTIQVFYSIALLAGLHPD